MESEVFDQTLLTEPEVPIDGWQPDRSINLSRPPLPKYDQEEGCAFRYTSQVLKAHSKALLHPNDSKKVYKNI